ncbi:MAG: bis(5'-nucleosyl)-tetraphosphatase (symmetrical) YqeK [Clostridia bacterium]
MNKSEIIKLDLYAQNPIRIAHIEGVFECACILKNRHFPEISDEEIAQAAYMHDFTKEWNDEKQLELMAKYNFPLDECELNTKKLYHAKSAYLLCKFKYELPQNVCDAVLFHTTGKENMTGIEKVIYLADYIEKNRTHTDCIDVRDTYNMLLAKNNPNALDEAILYSLDFTLEHLLNKGFLIHKNTINARNFLINKLNNERNNI